MNDSRKSAHWREQYTEPDAQAFKVRGLPVPSHPGQRQYNENGDALWPDPRIAQLEAQQRFEAEERVARQTRRRRLAGPLGGLVMAGCTLFALGAGILLGGHMAGSTSHTTSARNTLTQAAPNYDPTSVASAQVTSKPTPTAAPKTKPGATATPASATPVAPAPTPTRVPPAPTPTSQPSGPQWGFNQNAAPTYAAPSTTDASGNPTPQGKPISAGTTDGYACQTNGFAEQVNPIAGTDLYVPMSDIQFNGSLPGCGTANAASQAAALALVATHFAPAVWRQDL